MLGLSSSGASHHVKEKIFTAYIQSVLTYETERWPMKAENLHIWRAGVCW